MPAYSLVYLWQQKDGGKPEFEKVVAPLSDRRTFAAMFLMYTSILRDVLILGEIGRRSFLLIDSPWNGPT
jgi:hypothetical protein